MGDGTSIAPPAEPATTAEKKRGLIRRGFDLMPTSWFATGVVAIFLGVTAAFGGLDTVADPIADVPAGTGFTGAGFDMTVTGATLVDGRRSTGLEPKEGQRVLLVAVDVTVDGPNPRNPGSAGSLREIRVVGVDGPPVAIRADDLTYSGSLQPAVETPLLLAWLVPADLEGSEAVVQLPTATEARNNLSAGTRWDFTGFGARTSVTVVDGGAGDAEPTA
ncbi:MAG: hypothetical protein JSS74_05665 [Actinobacteria bacterium]|nr:hypothetical protein [Actinomycetota bacterium]